MKPLPGITMAYASKTISGFPFNIDVVFTGFTVEGQGAHGPFRWTTEKFALHRLTYGRAQDIYEAAGNQTLIWADGHGKSHELNFLPGLLHASAGMDGRGLLRFDLEAVAAAGQDSDGVPFTAAHAGLHLRRDPKADALDLMISGDDIKTSGSIAGLFGDHIKSLKLYATLSQDRHSRRCWRGRHPGRRRRPSGTARMARWRSVRWRSRPAVSISPPMPSTTAATSCAAYSTRFIEVFYRGRNSARRCPGRYRQCRGGWRGSG